MITLKEVLVIHQYAIEKFGGSEGVRDMNLLDSAIQRPYATFDQKELYPTSIEKSAALIESIVKNHPFSDGNKRTGYILMRLTLLLSGNDIEATEQDKYQFVIGIAEARMDYNEIKSWIEKHLKAD